MTDVLIRGLPDDVVAALDAQAARLGLSRNEFIKRELGQVRQRQARPVEPADLSRFAETFGDLGDADIMGRAWS